ncbi:DUF2892 domain-containing protein [Aciditerrimonas ferrireducens]|jgi:hypothetical protein|uniref:DUF2892 domain-containing protein n=1 Tax=Aciditerrimonas ferrireducens TaxID=667306 RepID=A0ABV6C043_9ACTN
MRKNMGTWDRVARGVLGAAALAGSGLVGFTSPGGIVLLVVTAVMGSTAASGVCPLYSALHIKTTRRATTGSVPAARSKLHLHRAA